MENLPTAEELFKTVFNINQCYIDYDKEGLKTIKQAMIEFAKLHVQQALKEASEGEIEKDIYMMLKYGEDMYWKKSILNSYPIDKIK